MQSVGFYNIIRTLITLQHLAEATMSPYPYCPPEKHCLSYPTHLPMVFHKIAWNPSEYTCERAPETRHTPFSLFSPRLGIPQRPLNFHIQRLLNRPLLVHLRNPGTPHRLLQQFDHYCTNKAPNGPIRNEDQMSWSSGAKLKETRPT